MQAIPHQKTPMRTYHIPLAQQAEQLVEVLAVPVLRKDRSPFQPPSRYVIPSARDMHSQRPRHGCQQKHPTGPPLSLSPVRVFVPIFVPIVCRRRSRQRSRQRWESTRIATRIATRMGVCRVSTWLLRTPRSAGGVSLHDPVDRLAPSAHPPGILFVSGCLTLRGFGGTRPDTPCHFRGCAYPCG